MGKGIPVDFVLLSNQSDSCFLSWSVSSGCPDLVGVGAGEPLSLILRLFLDTSADRGVDVVDFRLSGIVKSR